MNGSFLPAVIGASVKAAELLGEAVHVFLARGPARGLLVDTGLVGMDNRSGALTQNNFTSHLRAALLLRDGGDHLLSLVDANLLLLWVNWLRFPVTQG